MSKITGISIATVLVSSLLVAYLVGQHNGAHNRKFQLVKNAQAADESTTQDGKPTTDAALPRGRTASAIVDGKYPASYFPNTELLGKDEMRITALGTGMPNLTRNSATISYLVELGNGDKFLFDVGEGILVNLYSLRPDFSRIDKIFVSHLHADHVGDLMGVYIGGWISGRYTPLRVFGPSGDAPEMGTKHLVKKMEEAYIWDITTRVGTFPDAGAKLEINEFDYKQLNEVVYQENGVTIRSWPAIHALGGPVSYSVEWNGLKYVFGGDTYPNKWYMEYAKEADVASHECFLPPQALAEYYGWGLDIATIVSTRAHTEPVAFGKIMAELKPRIAVGYHSVQSPANNAAIMDEVRKVYDGPLALARDLMVINVTKDDLVVRMASVDDYPLPPEASEAFNAAPRSGGSKSPGEFIMKGMWDGYTPPPIPGK